MKFERTTDTDRLTEWTSADGNTTIRLRERAGGDFAVRYDRLYQADGGRGYAFERVETRAEAEALAADWRETPPTGAVE